MAWIVLEPSAPRLPPYTFYQPSLSGATTSKIKKIEGLTLSSYTLEIWGNIFLVLEEEAHQTPMLSPEGIKRAKGEGVKTEKRVIPLIEASPEDLSIN